MSIAAAWDQGGKKLLLVRVLLPPSIFDWLLNPFFGVWCPFDSHIELLIQFKLGNLKIE
jgi:hypothetical protein